MWGALRWDDIQKVNPKELKYYAGRMTTTLRYTKTTGPTKRVQELPVCISEHAYVTTPFWLKTGFDLFKRDADFDRDYMLPKLNGELTGFRRVMANYNDVTSYSAMVRRMAKRPGSDVHLIYPVLASFWTEHSERATLPTGLALLRASRDERDMLGRWKPDGSDTFIRMYNGVIARLQLQFAKATRREDRTILLDERDIVESATSWMTDRCNPIPDEQLGDLLEHLESSLKWKAQAGWELAEEADLTGSDGTEELAEQIGREPRQVVAAAIKEAIQPLYVVVNNGSHAGRPGACMLSCFDRSQILWIFKQRQSPLSLHLLCKSFKRKIRHCVAPICLLPFSPSQPDHASWKPERPHWSWPLSIRPCNPGESTARRTK